jgi:hypothetical protein
MALTTLSVRWAPREFWTLVAAQEPVKTLAMRWAPREFWRSAQQKDIAIPTITTTVTPGAISPSTDIVIRIVDTGAAFSDVAGLGLVSIAIIDTHGNVETVGIFHTPGDSNFTGTYSAGGSVVAYGNGIAITLHRDDGVRAGWPFAGFDVFVSAVDNAGNMTSTQFSYTVSPNYETAPSITYTPVDSSVLSGPLGTDTVQIDATETSPDSIQSARIVASYGEGHVKEVVFDGAPGSGGMDGFTVVESSISGGRRWVISRDAGWPTPILDFDVVVKTLVLTNVVANGYLSSVSYSVSDPAPAVDAVPPEVSNVTPAAGTPLDPAQAVSFDVTDDTGLFRRILVTVRYAATGQTEVVHDGDGFLGFYQVACSRNPITDGYHYSIVRDGGWPSSPTLRVFAFDRGGNEA